MNDCIVPDTRLFSMPAGAASERLRPGAADPTGRRQCYRYIWQLAASLCPGAARPAVRRAALLRCRRVFDAAGALPDAPGPFWAGLYALAQADQQHQDAGVHPERHTGCAGQPLCLLERLAGQALPPAADSTAAGQAWRYLPRGLQDCLLCRRVLGLSEAETALLLGLTAQLVARRTWQALEALAVNSAELGGARAAGSALDEAFGLKPTEGLRAANGPGALAWAAASRYIEALNSGKALPLGEFLACFPWPDAQARRQVERVLYYLHASDPPLARLREALAAYLRQPDPASAGGADWRRDYVEDCLYLAASRGLVPDAATAPLFSPDAQPRRAADDPARHDRAEPGLEPHSCQKVSGSAKVLWQARYVRQLIAAARLGDGLAFLDLMAEEAGGGGSDKQAQSWRYMIPYLYAAIYLRANQPLRAEKALLDALALVSPHSEAELRVRDLLGAALTVAERPDEGLREHQKCFVALLDDRRTDPDLATSIYVNMADDLLMLNEINQAVSLYDMALTRLQCRADAAALGAIYRRLGVVYTILGDHPQAMLRFWRAMGAQEAIGAAAVAPAALLEMAECRIAQGCLAEARQLLRQVQAASGADGDALLRCRMYRALTNLAIGEGALIEASRWNARSIELARATSSGADGQPDEQVGYAVSTRVSALFMAARLAEAQARTRDSDSLFRQALALLEPCQLLRQRARLAFEYADVLRSRGAHAEAVSYYREALCCRMLNRAGA